ncbi:secernin-3 [Candidatus Poribacteria bacterium]|nr:secernin-3 [Candidatus Poribacteria bacterium]
MIPRSCDTMVALANATSTGDVIFAKNSDRPVDECQPLELHARQTYADGAVTECQFVSLPEAPVTHRHIGSRPYWCWGYEHGANEHQVVIGNEGLGSRLPEASEPKLIGMEIIRLALERSRSASEAVDVITGLVSEYGQGRFANDAGVRTYDNGYIVADPREAFVIETGGHHWAVKRVERALGISNVYSIETDWERLSRAAASHAREHGWEGARGRLNFADAFTLSRRDEGSGAMRRRRACAVLDARLGDIDARTMMSLLSDHSDGQNADEPFVVDAGYAGGICIHCNADGTGGNTAASLVSELCADGSRLAVHWCALYSPCLALFLPMFVEGELPEALAIGGETPSDDSPWWTFHRLAAAVRVAPDARAEAVREAWAPVQDALSVSAYEMAGEGRRSIDDGRATDANALLTRYMAENTATMLRVATDLLDWLDRLAA